MWRGHEFISFVDFAYSRSLNGSRREGETASHGLECGSWASEHRAGHRPPAVSEKLRQVKGPSAAFLSNPVAYG